MTARAASLRVEGMVMVGVFKGVMYEVINKPAKILPQASRLIGLIKLEWFSLIGGSGLCRGCPIETK